MVSISGPTTITVKATDHAGRSVRQSVTVTTVYATPSERATPWQNYPRTVALTPYSVCRPRSLQDVVAIVQEAEAASKRVHAVGSGYSFSKSP